MEKKMTNLLANISMLLSSSTRIVETAKKVDEVLNNIVSPCLGALGSMAVIYIIVLGIQYAKSENDEKRAEAKKRLINMAIGAGVMMILLIFCLAIDWAWLIPQLFGYVGGNTSSGTGDDSSSSGGGAVRIPRTLDQMKTFVHDLKFLFRV